MGDPLATPAIRSFFVSELLMEVIKSAQLAYKHGDLCKELVAKLVQIEPIVSRIGQIANTTKHVECMEWLKHFKDILKRAEALIKDCSKDTKKYKTMWTIKFLKWNKLSSLLSKINYEVDEARANASMLLLGVDLSTNVRESLGFAKQTTPSMIVGVDEHFDKLKTSILQSHGRVDVPSIFGVQGRGGAGKTLLAQMLNNDDDVKEVYGEDSIIWITVGLEASVGDLYEYMGKCSILDCDVSKKLKSFYKEDQRIYLKEAFSEKKVLLILDDVWERQYDHHDLMYWLDVVKAPGSTILITTRNEAILRRARVEVSVVLSLDDEDSWELFSSHAFVDEMTSLKTIPEDLARAICRECKGLPLALKVTGSAMMDKMSSQEWESALSDLRQSRARLYSNVDDDLFGCLELSYKELKNDATRICFLYFAVFPEGHRIEVGDLINIWIEEELFGSNLSTEEATMRGYDHLRTLARLSMIQWNQGEEYASIHDLLRDLALDIIDNAKVGEPAYECLFLSKMAFVSFPTRERINGLKRISFMNCNISELPKDLKFACPEVKVCILRNIFTMDNKAPLGLFRDMINLRFLDLSKSSCILQSNLLSITNFVHLTKLNLSLCYSLDTLPKNIGILKYLREMDLSKCGSLSRLPESIGNLDCLILLNLEGCGSLVQLPESMGNLNCLMVLDLSLCKSLIGLPESMGNLESLTKLNLRECGSLIHLPESIGNLKCCRVLNLSLCKFLRELPECFGNLKCLIVLDLSFCGSLVGLPDSIGNLKSLSILDLSLCESLLGLPESISNLNGLTMLNLSYCVSLTRLPMDIGNLECLSKLYLGGCGSLTRLPESIGNLKCLTELYLSKCGSLMGLPKCIDNLKCLKVLDLS